MSTDNYLLWFIVTAVVLVTILVVGTLRAAEIPMRAKHTSEERETPAVEPPPDRLSPGARRG